VRKPFSSWKEGAPIYGAALVVGSVVTVLTWPTLSLGSLAFLVPGLFALNFFRDPVRTIPDEPGAVVSPADGKVVEIAIVDESPFYDGACLRISIFLNVFNVHVNRVPVDATVTRIERQSGVYLNAMNPKSSTHNVANTLWLDTPHGPMTVRQITGAVARRIVCRAEAGDAYARGEKFGMIKFGSRTELYLPAAAHAEVRVGQTVKGGSSILARIP
jgi:phosphatidylserine decarboxylase